MRLTDFLKMCINKGTIIALYSEKGEYLLETKIGSPIFNFYDFEVIKWSILNNYLRVWVEGHSNEVSDYEAK